jgi:hypothetical protein
MTSVTIVAQEKVGDLLAVTFEIDSGGVFSVGGLEVDETAYQASRGSRVSHTRNRSVVRDVVYMKPPFSQEEFDRLVAPAAQSANAVRPADFSRAEPALQEKCFVKNGSEREFYRAVACPQQITSALKQKFSGVDLSRLSLISSPAYNEVLKQNVISTFLWEDDVPGLTVDGMKLIARSRKFCLESGGNYDRLYVFSPSSESYKFLPSSCKVLAKSVNTHASSSLKLPEFLDIYFRGDHAEVQQKFGLPPRLGAERTYYGATLVNNDVVRVKQYCYDAPGIFHDWDGTVRRAAGAHGITPG